MNASHILVAALMAMALAACGDDGDESAPTTTTTVADATTTTVPGATTTTTDGADGVALSQSCTHTERDVSVVVRYPAGWHVNQAEGVTPCTAFDPDPFELQAGTEFPRDLAVVVRVEPISLARATEPAGLRVEQEREMTIDGRRALRVTAVSTGEGLDPAGLRSIRYVVDAGTDRVILAMTFDVPGNDFERSTEVLDAMAAAFDIQPRG